MSRLTRLVLILTATFFGLAVSSLAQEQRSVILEALTKAFHPDEIIRMDVGLLVMRGSLELADGSRLVSLEIGCHGKMLVLRDLTANVQDVYGVDGTFCDDLVRGLRQRGYDVRR